MTFLARLFGREVNPSDHARFLAKLGAEKRARMKSETTEALKASEPSPIRDRSQIVAEAMIKLAARREARG